MCALWRSEAGVFSVEQRSCIHLYVCAPYVYIYIYMCPTLQVRRPKRFRQIRLHPRLCHLLSPGPALPYRATSLIKEVFP